MLDAAIRIGTLREKPLHASLKRWYARAGDRAEVAVDGYVVDLVRGELLIEIQTRGFSGMKPKITALLARGHSVRIVHPIAVERPNGAGRRRRHGRVPPSVAKALQPPRPGVGAGELPRLVAHPRFEIEVLLTLEEEYRRHDPGRCWRRRGWTVVERRLVEVVDRIIITSGEDLACLLPDGLPDPFTSADLAVMLKLPRRTAQQMTYCLRGVGVITAVGKRGHATEYRQDFRGDRSG